MVRSLPHSDARLGQMGQRRPGAAPLPSRLPRNGGGSPSPLDKSDGLLIGSAAGKSPPLFYIAATRILHRAESESPPDPGSLLAGTTPRQEIPGTPEGRVPLVTLRSD